MAWDTTELAAIVRQEMRAPGSASSAPTGLDDLSILRAANTELFMSVVLELLNTHEEYLTRDTDVTLVAGASTYALPTRSVLRKLRKVLWLNSDGVELELHPLMERDGNKPALPGTQSYYRFQDNEHLVLYPTPDAGGTLRLVNYRRPNRLVPNTTGAAGYNVVATAKTATTITHAGVHPSGWAAGTKLDLVSAVEPFSTVGEDIAISSLTSTVLTLAVPAAAQALAASDLYVCNAGEAPFVQLPLEYFHLLATRTVARLQKGGDPEARGDAVTEATAFTGSVTQATVNRDDGQAKPIKMRTWGCGR